MPCHLHHLQHKTLETLWNVPRVAGLSSLPADSSATSVSVQHEPRQWIARIFSSNVLADAGSVASRTLNVTEGFAELLNTYFSPIIGDHVTCTGNVDQGQGVCVSTGGWVLRSTSDGGDRAPSSGVST